MYNKKIFLFIILILSFIALPESVKCQYQGVANYIGTRASDPNCIKVGQVYFNTVTSKTKVCTATGAPGTWENIGTSATGNGTPGGNANELQYQVDATTFGGISTATTDGTTLTVTDNNLLIADNAASTKRARFETSGVTTGQTRVITVPDSNTTLPIASQIVTIAGPTAARTYTFPDANTTIAGVATTQTLTNKTLTAPVIATIVNTGTLTLPTSTDTLVGRATTDTLTNKTISGASNTITNVSLTSGVTGTLPVANGGTGITDLTFSGNTAKVVTTTGTLTNGDCVKIDANGNFVANGSACGSGGGGEANTASNVGGGLSNFNQKTGVDLEFNTFLAADFNLSSNVISIDYTNGQAASGSTKGFLTSADWTTFNNKQAGDTDLTDIAGLSPTNDDIIQRKAGAWTNRTMAQLKTDLALVKADVGLSNVDNTSDSTKNSATATLTNKTLTSSTNVLGGVTLTLGSDATGDVYYRNSGGVLTRLGIGSTGQVLTVAGGLPSWGTSSNPAAGLTNNVIPRSDGADGLEDGSITDDGTTVSIATGSGEAIIELYEAAANGTNKVSLTVAAAITSDVVVTLPSATDTLVGRATTDTLTNKTLTAPIISTISNTGTLTLPTSTDTLVGRATTDTLTNKTLTAARIANAGFLADANGNELLIFTTTASAVNEVTFANAATGANPKFTASGGDSNVGIDLQVKGTGVYNLLATTSGPTDLRLFEDTDNGSNYVSFIAPATIASNFVITLPGRTGTLATTTGTLTTDNCAKFDSNGNIVDAGAACGGGGGSPGGSNTQVQYNNSSAFGGISGATSDGTNMTFGSTNLRATSPRFITDISDTNGNEVFKITATSSAVNEFTVVNSATGNAVQLQATGGDTNISMNLVPKGSGVLQAGGLTVATLNANASVPIIGWQGIPDSSGNVFLEPYPIKATNDVWKHNVLIYNDTSTDDSFYSSFRVPDDYDTTGTTTITVTWTSTATSGNVVWEFSYRDVTGDDTTSLDQTGSQETATVTDAAPGAANRRLTASITLTASNFAAGDTVTYRITRKGTSGSDTMAAAAILQAIHFTYKRKNF